MVVNFIVSIFVTSGMEMMERIQSNEIFYETENRMKTLGRHVERLRYAGDELYFHCCYFTQNTHPTTTWVLNHEPVRRVNFMLPCVTVSTLGELPSMDTAKTS